MIHLPKWLDYPGPGKGERKKGGERFCGRCGCVFLVVWDTGPAGMRLFVFGGLNVFVLEVQKSAQHWMVHELYSSPGMVRRHTPPFLPRAARTRPGGSGNLLPMWILYVTTGGRRGEGPLT